MAWLYNRPALTALLVTYLAGCGSPNPAAWSGPDDCRALEDTAWRDECFSRVAVDVFRQDPAAGEALVSEVSDPLVRDYIYLAVTREVDPGNPRYCRKIERKELRVRCEMLVRRPHLHRELVGERAPPGASGPGEVVKPGRESPPR